MATRHQDGRLRARPGQPHGRVAPHAGVRPLGLVDDRDALLIGPTGETHAPIPLIVSLHGAGGDAPGGLALFAEAVADRDLLLLAVPSRGPTWDLLAGGFGADVGFLDGALDLVFDSFDVDRERIALAGFSDGASYALSLGLRNGDLFTRVVAFAPCVAVPGPRVGRPPIFVAHGVEDPVLPIDRCSRRLVAALRSEGYAVRYEEFTGGHVVPRWLSVEAVVWIREALPSAGTSPESPP